MSLMDEPETTPSSLLRALRAHPRRRLLTLFLLLALGGAVFARPFSSRGESVVIRGKPQPVEVYDPASGSASRPVQVLVVSGDIGWVGISVDIAEHLSSLGYRVIGFNARAYLASFTGKDVSLAPDQVSGDTETLLSWAGSARGFPSLFVIVGVSEGAGLGILAAGQAPYAPRCKGIVALGLPRRTSLGWRWTDFPMWVTKKDPREPLADTEPYLKQIRAPLVMIHSTSDEWDPIDFARAMFNEAPQPKKFIAVDAPNHRFSGKVPEVLSYIDAALRWMENPAATQVP